MSNLVRPQRWDSDGHDLRSSGELALLRALQRVREAMPEDDRLSFTANALVEAGPNQYRVDFLVSHRGRSAVFEVDGPWHRGTRAGDLTRDVQLENYGVARVFRVPVEATNDPAELDQYVLLSLRLLRRSA